MVVVGKCCSRQEQWWVRVLIGQCRGGLGKWWVGVVVVKNNVRVVINV